MITNRKIRVGIVGANPSRGFAPIAHIPALQALADFEISAVCTTRQDSADAAARHYGVPLAFRDAEKLAQHTDVDLVTVSVKVPDHSQPVMAAIEAGKHVYCEWPLGRNTDEAIRMRDAADRKGIRHAVGLQGQVSPAINYTKDLIVEGYVGRVLSATMIGCAPNWGPTIDRAYQADFANGANLLTITGGHTIDALCYCLGEFRELVAFVVSQRERPVDGRVRRVSSLKLCEACPAPSGLALSCRPVSDPLESSFRRERNGRGHLFRKTATVQHSTLRWG